MNTPVHMSFFSTKARPLSMSPSGPQANISESTVSQSTSFRSLKSVQLLAAMNQAPSRETRGRRRYHEIHCARLFTGVTAPLMVVQERFADILISSQVLRGWWHSALHGVTPCLSPTGQDTLHVGKSHLSNSFAGLTYTVRGSQGSWRSSCSTAKGLQCTKTSR